MTLNNARITILLFILTLLSVLFNVNATAQERDSYSIKNYIDNFNKNTITEKKEKLFIHFDRPAYYSGDKMWFKAYLLMAANLQNELHEKILYVEFRGLRDSLAIKRNYEIKNGLVNGVFYLPDTIPTGKYRIVAYTNWMRNDFGGEFFEQDVFIFNMGKVQSTSNETDSAGVGINKTVEHATDTFPENSIKKIHKKLSVKFYPEGGTFVDKLITTVAFEVLDDEGKPAYAEGSIKDDQGSFITFFKTFNRGRGFFLIKPDKKRTYKAFISAPESETKTFSLPEIKQHGFVLNVRNDFFKDSLILRVKARMSGIKARQHFYLMGMQNDIVKMALQGEVGDGSIIFKCDKKVFNTGIVTLTLLDANMTPRCERLTFINHYDELNINVSVNDTLFQEKKFVKLSLDVKEKSGIPVTGDFSLSVTDVGIISDSLYNKQNIVNYLYLGSELPDIKEDASQLLGRDENSNNLMDMVMLTNGWRKFKWRKIDRDFVIQPRYKIEQKNWIKGTVKRKGSLDKAVTKVNVIAFLKGEYNDFYSTKTDKQGEFMFSLLDFPDTVDVSFQTTNRMDSKRSYVLELNTNLPILENSKKDNALLKIVDITPKTLVKVPASNIQSIRLPVINTQKLTPNFEDELEIIEDTATILLREVEVNAEKKKTPKEKITTIYGSPRSVVSDKQIETIMKQDTWKSSLFEMIQDLFPELSVVINTLNIDDFTFSGREEDTMGVFEEDLSLGFVDAEALVLNTYHIPPHLMTVFLKNARGRLLYIYVDGEYIASTNERGSLILMRIPYVINDLVDIDPKSVKSVELILDIKDKPDKLQVDDDFIDYARIRGNPAILAIYTKKGLGLYSDDRIKGMQNMQMLGFIREREFYSPHYSDTATYLTDIDKRVTLYWNPEVRLDSTGHADLSFYNSDIATALRVELTGISSDGVPGSKREVFGESLISENKTENNIIHADSSPLVFNQALWMRYLKEYSNDSLITGIVLSSFGQPIPFADILIKNANIETTANMSGIFAFDKNIVGQTDTIFISDPGKGFLATGIEGILNNNGIVKINNSEMSPESVSVKSLMSDILKQNSNDNLKRQSFDGIYRETIRQNGFIYSLSDYSVNMEQYGYFRSDQPHISHVEKGRQFRTTNYRQVIKFKPLSPLNYEIVQLREPILDDLYFISKRYKKSLDFELEGSTVFRGQKVYKITFHQKENTIFNLFDGFLLVQANNLEVLYIYRKTSAVARKFQTGDSYLEETDQYSDIKFIENEYRNSYREVNGSNVTKFQYFRVKLEADGMPISYTREFHGYGHIENGDKGRKKIPLNDLKHTTTVVKYVKYMPALWRNSTYLLPDFLMFDNAKNLHKITFYKKR